MGVFARDASCVRNTAGDVRGTVATFDIRDGKGAKEGREKEKRPGPPRRACARVHVPRQPFRRPPVPKSRSLPSGGAPSIDRVPRAMAKRDPEGNEKVKEEVKEETVAKEEIIEKEATEREAFNAPFNDPVGGGPLDDPGIFKEKGDQLRTPKADEKFSRPITIKDLKYCRFCGFEDWWNFGCDKCATGRQRGLADKKTTKYQTRCSACGQRRTASVEQICYMTAVPDSCGRAKVQANARNPARPQGPCHICSKDWYKLDCHCRERIRGKMANDAQIPWPKGCPDCGATLEVVIENNIH